MKHYAPPVLSVQEAKRLGYESLTLRYGNSPEEQRMFQRVLDDMKTVDHCIIKTAHGPEVGRPKLDLLR